MARGVPNAKSFISNDLSSTYGNSVFRATDFTQPNRAPIVLLGKESSCFQATFQLSSTAHHTIFLLAAEAWVAFFRGWA
jgi:hypothetical protein